MLTNIREEIITGLWNDYLKSSQQAQRITSSLQEKNIAQPALDHLAIIDLPGPNTGISVLARIFSALEYEFQGRGYLPEKQNDFAWFAAKNSSGTQAKQALPQVVVADFRLGELPADVRNIIIKYSRQASPSPAQEIETLAKRAANHDEAAAQELKQRITKYLAGRDWPLPTVREFETVRTFNELLAWVLVFGRKPNHFTFSIHLLREFENLTRFHHFVEKDVGLPLNQDGGVIKGGIDTGIEQGSTAGIAEQVTLADGTVELPSGFVEFVWRFENKPEPMLWDDYFTGFVANHANRVIQSLYTKD